MSMDHILDELKSTYRNELDGTETGVLRAKLGSADVERWSTSLAISRSALYDTIAFRLAQGFDRGELPFSFCDAIVNDIHGIINTVTEHRPGLFWDVFLAFDAGEYYRVGEAEDPVEKYTRPAIAKIIQKHREPRS